MTLRELLGDGPDVVVTGLIFDNRLVAPGTLFFCVPGFTRDGHDFAPDAVARGAVALVVQRPLGLGVPEVVVPDVREAMSVAAARFFRHPTAARGGGRWPRRASTATRRRRCGSRASPAPTARRRPRSSRGRCWRARGSR